MQHTIELHNEGDGIVDADVWLSDGRSAAWHFPALAPGERRTHVVERLAETHYEVRVRFQDSSIGVASCGYQDYRFNTVSVVVGAAREVRCSHSGHGAPAALAW